MEEVPNTQNTQVQAFMPALSDFKLEMATEECMSMHIALLDS
jgi:hypothetical protein